MSCNPDNFRPGCRWLLPGLLGGLDETVAPGELVAREMAVFIAGHALITVSKDTGPGHADGRLWASLAVRMSAAWAAPSEAPGGTTSSAIGSLPAVVTLTVWRGMVVNQSTRMTWPASVVSRCGISSQSSRWMDTCCTRTPGWESSAAMRPGNSVSAFRECGHQPPSAAPCRLSAGSKLTRSAAARPRSRKAAPRTPINEDRRRSADLTRQLPGSRSRRRARRTEGPLGADGRWQRTPRRSGHEAARRKILAVKPMCAR
jgi:hypothetical protein